MDTQFDKMPRIQWDCKSDMDSMISSYVQMRDNLIHKLRNSESSICEDCPQIERDNYSLDKKIQVLTFEFNSPCQLSCVYCVRRNAVSNKDMEDLVRHFDYQAFLEILEKRGLISENTLIGIVGGEFSIDPRKQELLNIFDKYRWKILTNAVVFDNALAEVGGKLGNSMNVSVDAGTRETFKKIKGMDVSDQVWENIRRYIEHGATVDLKYIFLPENSDDENVENFIKKALNARVSTILISANIIKTAPHTDDQIRLMAKMYRLAENNGMTPQIMRGEVPGDDVVKIQKILEENAIC